MAVFQEVDKCMRCNGCVISCKRTWKMKALNPGIHKTAPDQRVIIKSQKKLDMGGFVRFSCWHCPDPPCAKRCPFSAIVKEANGAVSIDPVLCKPDETNPANGKTCTRQCVADCQHGGYPKVGVGSDLYTTPDAWKCTLCNGRAGDTLDLDSAYGNPLPTNYNKLPGSPSVADMDHEPSCVYTCPAKAMKWDTRARVMTHIGTPANGYISYIGNGSMYWASKKYILAAPKADPFIEDHVTPLISSVLSESVSKAALAPTLVAGGIMAVIMRRIQLAQQADTEGEV
jgi:Fe-S-cluster-containing dehydrogenase component